MGMAIPHRILDFWFGPPDSAEFGRPRKVWFEVDPAFDAALRERFEREHLAALEGRYDALRESAEGCLALIILFDQIPRNIYRGTAKAFVSDAQALAVARHLLDRGFDAGLLPVQRLFAYLPFEHSEDLVDQERSVALFTALGNAEWLDYAVRHRDIVARFGRFPHRNQALGRESTAEETAFLATPGSSF